MSAPEPDLGFDSPAIEPSGVKQRSILVQLGLALASIIAVCGAAGAEALSTPVIVMAAVLWMLGPGRWLLEPFWKRPFQLSAGSVARWNDSLVVRAGDKQEILRAGQITDARLRPLEKKLDLVIDTGKIATIAAPAFEKVAPLLDAAGVPPMKRTYVAKLGKDASGSKVSWGVSVAASVAVGLGIVLGSDSPEVAIWVVPVLASVGLFLANRFGSPGEIALGPNGVSLGGATNRRFFHYGGLRDVRMDPSRLRIFTDDGSEVGAKIEGLDAAARETIEGWVQERRQAFASTAAGTDAFSVLDRHGRSLEAWRAALKGILQQEGQYRRAPISVEDLSRLLTNPHTPAERRIAAAFILGENATVMAQKQIRFAAESSSSQPMRIALRALAEDKIEESAIEEALEAETGSLAR